MAIEFHCEHCNHLIRAPLEAAGRQGKCPACGGVAYIPRPVAKDEGELELAPLDTGEEERRKRAALEDAAYQRSLLKENVAPGERGVRSGGAGKSESGGGGSAAPSALPAKQVASMIVKYVEAMTGGKLPEADSLADQLSRNRTQTLGILDEMTSEDLAAYGMPSLPRPVLMGFLKQLRTKLL